jgi:CheY-like chemotaxis protein
MLINQDGSVRTRIAIGSGARQVSGPTDAGGGGKDANPPFRLRILIVEDETVVAMRLEDLVQDLGHVVVGTVASHATAVAAAEASRPDLALMDINLGRGGNGIEAALELRRRFDVPSVFLSAYLSSPSVREWAQVAQPLGFVPKPYTERHIEAALKKAATHLGTGRN